MGPKSLLVTPSMIDSIIVDTSTRTTYNITTDSLGGAIITSTMLSDVNSCNSQNCISIQIGNSTPNWTHLYCKFESIGSASCWGWNGNNGYGVGLTSSQKQGNMLGYSVESGDFTKNEFNVWDLPQFNKYFAACDNETYNYMHGSYLIGDSRGFDLFSRRNNMSILAGPSHGRTCSNNGTITISNIRIIIL